MTGPLTATRALGVLDDARVPYTVVPGPAPWHRLHGEGRALHWYAGPDGVAGAFTLGDLPLHGSVAPDAAIRARVSALAGDWRPSEPILDGQGRHHASVWRTPDGSAIVPFDPDDLVRTLRSESYRELTQQRGTRLKSVARGAYYAARPLLPRRLQIAMRRRYTRVQARSGFPRWPVEPALHDLSELVLGWAADVAGEPLPCLAPWPAGRSWALVLTHDVEQAAGRDFIGRVRAVEEAAGYRSSWNLVPERYSVDDRLVAELWASGNEVGVHGLRHDGRDLSSLANLRRRLPEMRRWAERWGAAGFRSPATHRRWEWMPLLGFDYDSSYPDTDPYEPMPGGCCSWLPFFNGDQVELPITLPQDHTVFVLLQRDGDLWREKADVLRRRGGMALVIVHPDYMVEEGRLDAYAQFLATYGDDDTAWKALPQDVSAWWRRRAATSLELVAGSWCARGPAEAEAAVTFVGPSTATAAAAQP